MPKQHSIRWRKRDVENLQREIRNYNARVAYAMKKNPDAVLLDNVPETPGKNQFILADKKSFKDVKASIETRQDFNEVMASLKRFTAESAKPVKTERGGRLSKYMMGEAEIEQKRLKPIVEKELARINEIELKESGKSTGTKLWEMGSAKKHQTRAHERNINNLSMSDLPYFLKNLDNMLSAKWRAEERDQMRENYIQGLIDQGFLNSGDELETYIRGVDADTFYDNVLADDAATFFFYKDNNFEFEVRKTAIINTWKAAYEAFKAGAPEVVNVKTATKKKKPKSKRKKG